MATRSNRIREPKAQRIARRSGVPDAQIANDQWAIVDVVNHTEADQRAMVRSGAKDKAALDRSRQTVMRKTRIAKLRDAKIISPREAAVCEWYQATYENHYEARVRIADWGATGGSSDRAYGHWPAGAYLEPGMNMIEFARQAISPAFLPMFERVVLHGRPLGKLAISFRTAARQLLERVEGQVDLT